MVYDLQIMSSNFLAVIVRTAAVCLKLEQTEVRGTSARTRGSITDSLIYLFRVASTTQHDVRLVVVCCSHKYVQHLRCISGHIYVLVSD